MNTTVNLGQIIPDGTIRTVVDANLTLYVEAGGNDANDGLNKTTAFATIQAAVNALGRYDVKDGKYVTIQVGEGSFPSVQMSHTASTSPIIQINGSGEKTRIGNSGWGVSIYGRNSVFLSNMLLTYPLYACDGAFMRVEGNIVFEPALSGSNTIYARRAGAICLYDLNCVVRGTSFTPASLIYAADTGSSIQIREGAVTFEKTPAFSTAVVRCGTGGHVSWSHTVTMSGQATGTRYLVYGGGHLETGSVEPEELLPGDLTGSVQPWSISGMAGVAQAVCRMDASIIRFSRNVASATWESAGKCRITYYRANRTVNHAVVVTPVGTGGPVRFETTTTAADCLVSCYNAAGTLVSGPFTMAAF